MRFDTWQGFLIAQRQLPYFRELSDFVTAERVAHTIYPPAADVFNFTLTPLRDVKVVILGQDPYHGVGQAHGLAFSVRHGIACPPSLRNIFIELENDVQIAPSAHKVGGKFTFCGDLTPWTQLGILLLNTALTVRAGQPGSHLEQWRAFTDEGLRMVLDSADVAPHFILWGSHAKRAVERVIGQLLTFTPHWLAFEQLNTLNIRRLGHNLRPPTATYSPHPSPHSADRGFFGSRPFSRANEALRLRGIAPIDWRLP